MSQTRIRVTETAYNHATTAIGLFESTAYSQACFLAITAIEEMGKARTLQIIQMEAVTGQEPKRIDAKGIRRFFRNHKLKALRAAASGLSVNHGAARRHGRHEEADLNLSSGIILLAETDQWMPIRNSCLYTDVDLHPKIIKWPGEEINGDYAYYFICMALEVLAKESDAAFGSPLEEFEGESTVTDFETASEFEDTIMALLERFRVKYEDEFDETKLEFFTEGPQYDHAREKIRRSEVDFESDKRGELRTAVEQQVDQMDDKIDAEKLPEEISIEDYQQYWIEEMTDIAMDVPHIAPDELHPDLKELEENVREYIEY